MASSNRNPIRQWSITFPQCGEVSKEDFIQSFPPAVAYTCAREPHADGGWHLHLGIKLKKGLNKSALLKWIATRWPDDYMRIDVQATRNIKDWNDYLQKEDPNCLVLEEEKKERVPPIVFLRSELKDMEQEFYELDKWLEITNNDCHPEWWTKFDRHIDLQLKIRRLGEEITRRIHEGPWP